MVSKKSVIRPIAAAIGAAALVFVVAPGMAFAKDSAPGHHHSHSHEHPTHPTPTDTPLGPNLNRPQPPSRHPTPTPSTPDILKQLENELTAVNHGSQQAVAQQRAALIAQLAALQRALQLLKGGVTPPVTTASPPPATTPASSPTPSPTPPSRPSTPAAQQPAAVPSGPAVLTVGPTLLPGVEPQQSVPQSTTAAGAGSTPSAGGSSGTPAPESSHAALNQPIPGLSPKSTVLLFAILGAFAAGIMFLVLGAGYRGRRRA